MRRRPLRLAECKALHLLAGFGAEQQDLRRQDPLVTNAPLREPSFGAPAACCRNHWTDRHGARRLLQAALSPHWQGQGGDRTTPCVMEWSMSTPVHRTTRHATARG